MKKWGLSNEHLRDYLQQAMPAIETLLFTETMECEPVQVEKDDDTHMV